MSKFFNIALTCIVLLIAGQISFAAANQDAQLDNALLKKVKQAYQNTNQLQATAHVTISLKSGGWTTTRSGDVNIAFDRKNNQLKIVQPGFYTVASDGKLQMKSEQLPGQRLETSISKPITYDQLFKSLAQLMMNPKLANVALLTSKNPIQKLSLNAGASPKVTTQNGQNTLQFESEKGDVTLTIDPDTYMLKSMKMVAGTQFEKQANVDFFNVTCTYDIKSRNKKLDQDTFAFDQGNLTPASSVREMVQNIQKARNPKQNSANNRQQGAKSMEGKAAPHIVLNTLDGKKFDSNKTQAKVLVLDFWATWCGPCIKHGLPELQATYKWAKENNKDVVFYAVNQGESTKTVKSFWDNTSYKMDVLMDEQSLAGRKYNVTAIPSTIIIANGKVQAVQVGVAPGSSNKLKENIEKALQAAG